MRRPGFLAGRVLEYVSTAPTRERVFDEIVADMHFECEAARAEGRMARAAWIRARGHLHLLQVSVILAMHCSARAIAQALHRYFAPASVATAFTFGLFLLLASITTGADGMRPRPSPSEPAVFSFERAPGWRGAPTAIAPAPAPRRGSSAAP